MESACGNSGAGEADVFHRFVPPEAGDYQISLKEGFMGRFSVLADCGEDASACLDQGTGTETVVLALSQGVPVFVMVEGQGEYTLRIHKVCVPQCENKACGDNGCGGVCGTCVAPADVCGADHTCLNPGETTGSSCGVPFAVGALPFVGSGDTSEAYNHYSFGDDFCPGFVGKGGASKDQVWYLKAEDAGSYIITLTGAFQAALYAVSDCADINGTCLGASDDRDTERLSVELSGGESVYIIVDGASNEQNQEGTYQLWVHREGNVE